MSTKPMKPLKKPQKEIHIEDTESIKCEDCGNYSFIKSYFIRRIPPKIFRVEIRPKNMLVYVNKKKILNIF